MMKYKKLRLQMFRMGVTQERLGELLGLSTCTISAHFSGRIKWRIDQIYAVCDCLKIPYTEISEYFPKGGI